MRAAKQVARSYACHTFEAARTDSDMESLWSARKQALWASLAIRPDGTQIWSTDVAVPISKLAELIGMFLILPAHCSQRSLRTDSLTLHRRLRFTESSKDRAKELGLFNSVLGHVGDGNFHQMVMYDPNQPEQKEAVALCVDAMMVKAIELEGTVSVSLSAR